MRISQDQPGPRPVSKQRRWQLARQAEGRCPQCGEPGVAGGRCLLCLAKQARRIRARKGLRPWVPGGVGRPPHWARLGRKGEGEEKVSGER